jgi:hypothetical protein
MKVNISRLHFRQRLASFFTSLMLVVPLYKIFQPLHKPVVGLPPISRSPEAFYGLLGIVEYPLESLVELSSPWRRFLPPTRSLASLSKWAQSFSFLSGAPS